jgi:3-deoxy-manno-octulosonate cytidylyltransferase (CMP-KDO synthetase)
MKIIGIIPARYGSSRFPGKPLVDIWGKPMILRVVERAEASKTLSEVIVATDDVRIAEVVLKAGKRVVITSEEHPSGTDRCREVVEKLGVSVDAVINIQGDEPFVKPEQIDHLAQMMSDSQKQIATLAIKIEDPNWLGDRNKVKVVFDKNGKALYFSRQAIPYVKNLEQNDWLNRLDYFKHIGLYAYKTEVLNEICELKTSSFEQAESLEQLRWLQNGYSIFVGVTHWETPAIDSPADLDTLLKSNESSYL